MAGHLEAIGLGRFASVLPEALPMSADDDQMATETYLPQNMQGFDPIGIGHRKVERDHIRTILFQRVAERSGVGHHARGITACLGNANDEFGGILIVIDRNEARHLAVHADSIAGELGREDQRLWRETLRDRESKARSRQAPKAVAPARFQAQTGDSLALVTSVTVPQIVHLALYLLMSGRGPLLSALVTRCTVLR